MNRLDRRLTILRGKRNGAFDRDQYWLERADRARVSRKVRNQLRRMRPVVLVTPRWSLVHRFLDDLSCDLALGEPMVQARVLNLGALQGRPVHHSWTWLVEAITNICDLHGTFSGPAWQAVDGRGFRHVMTELFKRSVNGPRRCLMLFGLEYLHLEARDDLVRMFEHHAEYAGDSRRLNLLLAGSVAPEFDVAGAERIVLPDFAEHEAVETLVEYLGPQEQADLRAAVKLVGGVPALIHALADNRGRFLEAIDNQDLVWRSLGKLADEIRGAMNIVNSDDKMSSRLERICRNGSLKEAPDEDAGLVAAGLVRRYGRGTEQRVQVRAPVFADLVLES